MSELDQIPRADLIAMLLDRAWFSGDRSEFGERQGFSFEVEEETAIRDVVYRNRELYPTTEEALLACWKKHYTTEAKDER